MKEYVPNADIVGVSRKILFIVSSLALFGLILFSINNNKEMLSSPDRETKNSAPTANTSLSAAALPDVKDEKVQHVVQLARFLEQSPGKNVLSQSVRRERFTPKLFDISLDQELDSPKGLLEIQRSLAQLVQNKPEELNHEIEALFSSLRADQMDERFRLLKITFMAGQTSGVSETRDILFQQAAAFVRHTDPLSSKFGALALQYYLDLEKDPNIRLERVKTLVSDFILVE